MSTPKAEAIVLGYSSSRYCTFCSSSRLRLVQTAVIVPFLSVYRWPFTKGATSHCMPSVRNWRANNVIDSAIAQGGTVIALISPQLRRPAVDKS